MARDRQRAKRRQAERRAERLREQRRSAGARRASDGASQGARAEPSDVAAPARTGAERMAPEAGEPELDAGREAHIAAAAPPEDTGRSDTVVEAPPPAIETDGEAAAHRRERRAEGREAERGRVGAFLAAVWAELQRVQWPNRKTLVTLTGVVLGFVIIMGAYLGGLDWVFSRLVQALL
jgi:preprotein translocase subunit SecE